MNACEPENAHACLFRPTAQRGTNFVVLNMRHSLARSPGVDLMMVINVGPSGRGVAMSDTLTKRLVTAFGLGLVLALIFDHTPLGFAVGFGVVFGGGVAVK